MFMYLHHPLLQVSLVGGEPVPTPASVPGGEGGRGESADLLPPPSEEVHPAPRGEVGRHPHQSSQPQV